MKFATSLEEQAQDEWKQHYLDYRAMKNALAEAQNADAPMSMSPRTASLSVARHMLVFEGQAGNGELAGQELFMVKLQQELAKVAAFVESQAARLQQELTLLLRRTLDTPQLAELHAAAHRLGDAVLALERFVQLNQVGFWRIIKKHDKAFPAAPLRSFYAHHLANQPWSTDFQSKLWALVSAVFQRLHTAPSASGSAESNAIHAASASTSSTGARPELSGREPAAKRGASKGVASQPVHNGKAAASSLQGQSSGLLAADAVRTSYKYWVRQEDLSHVMYLVLQHLPMVPQSTPSRIQTAEQGRPVPSQQLKQAATDVSSPSTPLHPGSEMSGLTRPQSTEGSAARRIAGPFARCSTTTRCIYLDNENLELYHNRLYFRPGAVTVKLSWSGEAAAAPLEVSLQRKVYREGWKGEANSKDSMLLPIDKVAEFMDGRYTLWQAMQGIMSTGKVEQSSNAQPSTSSGMPRQQRWQRENQPLGQQDEHSQQQQQQQQQRQRQQQQQQPQHTPHHRAKQPPGTSSVSEAASMGGIVRVPACSKQLGLFSEVQGLVARRRLRPVLSTACQRLQFAMPYDPTLHITLDTDVVMECEASEGVPTPELWTQLLSEQLESKADAYRLPYCLLRITTCLPLGAAWPHWLQALVSSELVLEVEDWSKFVHGCAVLLLEQARAVPYWVDDPLIAESSASYHHDWEVVIDRQEGAEEGGAAMAGAHHAHSNGAAAAGSPRRGSRAGGHGENGSVAPASPKHARRHSGTGASSSGQVTAAPGSLSQGLTASFIARARSLAERQQAHSPRAGSGRQEIPDEFLLQLKKRRRGRRRHGHPAQLLALRDFLHNEDVFMTWLTMAMIVSGSALLLLSFSAIAKINPLSHPEIHIAEAIMLLLLPVSVLMVGYAIWLYLWRSRRLYHPMRYWRVDDIWGPNLMAFIIVTMLFAVLFVSITDMAIVVKKARKHVDPAPDPGPDPDPEQLLLGSAVW